MKPTTLKMATKILGFDPLDIPVEHPPRHTHRYVLWGETCKGKIEGRIFLLVGYCPDTTPYFMGLLLDALSSFPDLNLSKVTFGKVSNSSWAKGFTLLSAPISCKKRKINGYQEAHWQTFDVGY